MPIEPDGIKSLLTPVRQQSTPDRVSLSLTLVYSVVLSYFRIFSPFIEQLDSLNFSNSNRAIRFQLISTDMYTTSNYYCYGTSRRKPCAMRLTHKITKTLHERTATTKWPQSEIRRERRNAFIARSHKTTSKKSCSYIEIKLLHVSFVVRVCGH